MGRKLASGVLGGIGKLKADTTLLGPEEAAKRIVERVLESADSFLASDNVDPQDATVIRKAKSDVADHKDRLFRLLASITQEGSRARFATSLGVMLAGAFLIGSRAVMSETMRRQIGRDFQQLAAAGARRGRRQKRIPYEQILRSTISAVYGEHPGGSLKAKCREVNRRLVAQGGTPVSDVTIRRHRDRLGLR